MSVARNSKCDHENHTKKLKNKVEESCFSSISLTTGILSLSGLVGIKPIPFLSSFTGSCSCSSAQIPFTLLSNRPMEASCTASTSSSAPDSFMQVLHEDQILAPLYPKSALAQLH